MVMMRKPFDALVSTANNENGWVNWLGLATLAHEVGSAIAQDLIGFSGLIGCEPDHSRRSSGVYLVR